MPMRKRQATEWELAMGQRILELRDAAGLTQEALARKAGVGLDAVRNWEKGRRTPGLDMAVKLADALECTLDELAGREPPAKTAKKKGGAK
jgi:transcriptional regulator with XRE-family HTH domain